MQKEKLEQRIKVYLNKGQHRKLNKARLIKENDKSVWARLKDGNIIKRNKKRDLRRIK